MAYGDFIDLTRRRTVDKVLLDKTFNIAKHPNYEEYQRIFVERSIQRF